MKELVNLRQLRVDNNQIERIETLTFSGQTQLRLISLQGNRISAIARNAFDSMDGLVVLLLANNSIRNIGQSLSHLSLHPP